MNVAISASATGKMPVAPVLLASIRSRLTQESEDVVVVPVSAALYKGKAGGFSLKLQINVDKLAVVNVSEWIAVIDGVSHKAKWCGYYVSDKSKSALADGSSFYLAADIPVANVVRAAVDGTSTLPDGVPVSSVGGKWALPKAGKVALVKGAAAANDVDTGKFGGNPSGLKLSYAAKTGTFKGSFALYQDVSAGRPKLKKIAPRHIIRSLLIGIASKSASFLNLTNI